jgi:hypothetical protein
MMKVELKNCSLEEDHEHAFPYLETYEWEDGSSTQLPACCVNRDLGMDEFPTTVKRLIEINLTNELTQMVSGIYSSELMEIDKDIFFVSFYDVDEAPTGCYFIKGAIESALTEYLKYSDHLGIPFMNLFYAENNRIFDSDLSHNWISASTFSVNPDLEGLKIRVKTTGLNSDLDELINNAGLDKAKAELWQSRISNGSDISRF